MSAKISKERIGEHLKAILQTLADNGGQLPSREVMTEVEKRIDFNEYEKGLLKKSGNIRWQSVLHLYSIDLQKACWLVNLNGDSLSYSLIRSEIGGELLTPKQYGRS